MIESTVSRFPVAPVANPGRSARTSSSLPWRVQCDFDGTISQVDVTDSLLERFGQPGWEDLEAAWERGDIGSRECMRGQIGLLDMSESELIAHLDTIAIDPHFVGFVRAAQSMGLPVEVISDGMDRVIHAILQRHGLGDLKVSANHLVQTGDRRWALESPFSKAACTRASGTCKCACLATHHEDGAAVLFVGDSTSDFCVSGKADFVFAKSRLIDYCEAEGIAFLPIADFGVALERLADVIEPLRISA
jgi:2-hydroxy-3-keto-5-methylthiopentenyl-1-phosphate phosphatase